jgi:hypothetical protein
MTSKYEYVVDDLNVRLCMHSSMVETNCKICGCRVWYPRKWKIAPLTCKKLECRNAARKCNFNDNRTKILSRYKRFYANHKEELKAKQKKRYYDYAGDRASLLRACRCRFEKTCPFKGGHK